MINCQGSSVKTDAAGRTTKAVIDGFEAAF
jgi:hypothetical protein